MGQVLDARAEQCLRNSVLSNSSVFGQLFAISGMRNEDANYYHEMSWQYGVKAVDAILRSLHREVFDQWVGLSLHQQHSELRQFLLDLGPRQPTAYALAACSSALLPTDCSQRAGELFAGDLSVVICLAYSKTTAEARKDPSEHHVAQRTQIAAPRMLAHGAGGA